MRIGLFGGSFDPVHNGHVSMIKGALNSGLVDAVIVIPSVRNSFKRGRASSAAPYRFYMMKEVIDSELDKLPVYLCDIEFFIDGISYTAVTLERVCDRDYIEAFLVEHGVKPKKASEDHTFYWIVGSDILPQFDTWYMPDKILSYADLLTASRPGDGVDVEAEADRLFAIFGKRPEIFMIDEVEAASSYIRREGDYDDVPEAARDFIKTHAMYTGVNVLDHVSDDTAEQFLDIAVGLYPFLCQKRLLHTLNVGLLSCRYAHMYGADAGKALIAGALHDCAKELPIEIQRDMARKRSGDVFTDRKLLHSPAGAVFAASEFGVDDPEILDAITYHTTGCGNMSILAKIVFLADKIEPSRTYTDLTEIRRAAETDIDEALRMCASSVRDKFKAQGRELHPLTSDFMESLGI